MINFCSCSDETATDRSVVGSCRGPCHKASVASVASDSSSDRCDAFRFMYHSQPSHLRGRSAVSMCRKDKDRVESSQKNTQFSNSSEVFKTRTLRYRIYRN